MAALSLRNGARHIQKIYQMSENETFWKYTPIVHGIDVLGSHCLCRKHGPPREPLLVQETRSPQGATARAVMHGQSIIGKMMSVQWPSETRSPQGATACAGNTVPPGSHCLCRKRGPLREPLLMPWCMAKVLLVKWCLSNDCLKRGPPREPLLVQWCMAKVLLVKWCLSNDHQKRGPPREPLLVQWCMAKVLLVKWSPSRDRREPLLV
jgi:hypothetical protein